MGRPRPDFGCNATERNVLSLHTPYDLIGCTGNILPIPNCCPEKTTLRSFSIVVDLHSAVKNVIVLPCKCKNGTLRTIVELQNISYCCRKCKSTEVFMQRARYFLSNFNQISSFSIYIRKSPPYQGLRKSVQ
jgi:hypothetical protein